MGYKKIGKNVSGTGLSWQKTAVQKIMSKFRKSKVNKKARKVLLIDDDKRMIFSLKRWLRLNGFQCHISQSPIEGLEKARQIRPDIIVLDLNMPEMSGYGVLSELKKNHVTAQIPVVVLTGINDKDVAMGAMDLGAVGYVVKSYVLQDLILLIEEYLLPDSGESDQVSDAI